MNDNNRRDFLRTATRLASSSAFALTAASYSRVLGANERINLGVVGTGDRGRFVMGNFLNNPAIRVTSVCDIYGAHIDEAKQKVQDAKAFTDYRELLAKSSLDAMYIAV